MLAGTKEFINSSLGTLHDNGHSCGCRRADILIWKHVTIILWTTLFECKEYLKGHSQLHLLFTDIGGESEFSPKPIFCPDKLKKNRRSILPHLSPYPKLQNLLLKYSVPPIPGIGIRIKPIPKPLSVSVSVWYWYWYGFRYQYRYW